MMDDYGHTVDPCHACSRGCDCDRVRDERDQYREALVDANRRLDVLRSRIDAVRRTILDPGPFPEYHRNIMDAQRYAWPMLWDTLDDLLETRV